MLNFIFRAVLLLTVSLPSLSFASSCEGTEVILRISDVVGSLAGIEDAMESHERWYRTNGYEGNRLVLGTVQTENLATGKCSYDGSRAVTLNINPPVGDFWTEGSRSDMAWAAFIAKYRKNSALTDGFRLCFPKGVFVE